MFISQRNHVIDVLQTNFTVLKSMCLSQNQENLQLKDHSSSLLLDKKKLIEQNHRQDMKIRDLEREVARLKETEESYYKLMEDNTTLQNRYNALENNYDMVVKDLKDSN